MKPINSHIRKTLNSLKDSGSANIIAYAHNYLFEERVSQHRQKEYELNYPKNSEYHDWKKYHVSYIRNKIQIADEIPETFSQLNEDAVLPELDKNQYIVRVERLDRQLNSFSTNIAEFRDNFRKYKERSGYEKEDSKAWLESFCDLWNNYYRDNRPSFATFYDELEVEIESDDWPHLVRNRLGLSHYNIFHFNNTIPIALMRYKVKDVLKNTKKMDLAFCFPTVLDSEHNVHFFPAPKTAEYGRTLNLEIDSECENLISEILHMPINYKPDNFYKIGLISKPVPDNSLIKLRNDHLFCLRYESDNDKFGEEIPTHANES